jgi:hypothetical protein
VGRIRIALFLTLIIGVGCIVCSNQYDQWQAQKVAEQAKIKADQDAKASIAAWNAQADYQNELKAKRQAAYDELIKEQKAERDRQNLQWQQDQILAEIRRGNDIAQQAASDAAFNRIESREPLYQNSTTAAPATPPFPQPWVLKYNAWSHKWQYAPPDSALKYNAYENRWEWVPQ